jgi:hypothetical protein
MTATSFSLKRRLTRKLYRTRQESPEIADRAYGNPRWKALRVAIAFDNRERRRKEKQKPPASGWRLMAKT